MKLRDHKRTRNCRRILELSRARDRRENLIGVDTGYRDKCGKPILSGDRVHFERHESCGQIVLFYNETKQYAVFRGCWYGELNPFDPRCYGKVDFIFPKNPHKLTNIIKEVEP